MRATRRVQRFWALIKFDRPAPRGVFIFVLTFTPTLLCKMPPMAFRGLVTKVGFMDKTATVTVTRWVAHKLTTKVCFPALFLNIFVLNISQAHRAFQEVLDA